MFTITKKLLITATIISPLALLPTSASAFGMGGFHHVGGGMTHIGGMSQHIGSIGRMGGMMRGMGNLNRMGSISRLGGLHAKTNMLHGMNAGRLTGSHLHQADKIATDKIATHNPDFQAHNSDVKKSATTNFDKPSYGHERHRSGDEFSEGHTDRVYVPIYAPVVPGFGQPVFVDDQPRLPRRPVIAEDTGNASNATADAPAPNADTPNQIVKVDTPCDGAILKVTTARSACVNGVVQISGDHYYYCPSKNEFQVRHYEYTPVPEVKCDGTGQVTTSAYSVPRGWDTTRDPKVHACVDTGKTVVQWVAGPQFWEQATWHVYKCFDGNGQEVTRLFPDPDVKVSATSSADPAPISTDDLRK